LRFSLSHRFQPGHRVCGRRARGWYETCCVDWRLAVPATKGTETMQKAANSTLSALALVAFFHTGCGSADPDEGWLACADKEFRLQGTLDGQSINVLESSSGGGLTQLSTGEFSTQYVSLALDPARTKLDLQWPQTVFDGGTTSATGTLAMASSSPLAGQSYCLGSGTQIHMSGDGNTLQFKLAGVSGGAGCGAPKAGELQGCWR
jgi:hypothetical protein